MSSDSEKDDTKSLEEDGGESKSRDMMGIFLQRDLRPSSQEPIMVAAASSGHETGNFNHPMAATTHQDFQPSFAMQK